MLTWEVMVLVERAKRAVIAPQSRLPSRALDANVALAPANLAREAISSVATLVLVLNV